MNIEEYKFGQVMEEKIENEDVRKFAELFGEGSESLTNLIEFCILNNLNTFASCKGHPKKELLFSLLEEGYLSFNLNEDYDKNGDLAYYLADLPFSIKNLTCEICFDYNSLRKCITLRVPAHKDKMAETFFKQIHEKLIEYINFKQTNQVYESQNEDTKKIVDTIFSYPSKYIIKIKNQKYTKYQKEGIYIKKSATCPAYNNTNILHEMFNKNNNQIDVFLSNNHKK